MSNDIYSKAIFTVIAIALSVIAWKLPVTSTAHAVGDGCGKDFNNPCYIDAAKTTGLSVKVENWP